MCEPRTEPDRRHLRERLMGKTAIVTGVGAGIGRDGLLIVGVGILFFAILEIQKQIRLRLRN